MSPDNDVYDDKGKDSIPKPLLNSLENGDEDNGQKGKPAEGGLYNPAGDNKSKKALDPESLSKAETSSPEKPSLAGGLYNAAPEIKLATKVFGAIKGRSKGVIAGLVAFFVAGICALMFMLASGPGQDVQLSQILQRGFSGQQQTESSRGNNLFRFATAADIGETRVGSLSRRVLRPAVEDLANIGIKFNLTDTVGTKSVDIDTDKLAQVDPDLNNMTTDAEKIQGISDFFNSRGVNIDPSLISGSGSSFSIDSASAPMSTDVALGQASLSALDNGVIESTILNHVFSNYLGSSDLFHPISKALQNKAKQAGTTAAQKQEVENEESALESPSEELATPAVADVEAQDAHYGSPLNQALLLTGSACFARGIASDVNTINRDRVVLPAIAVAMHFISLGEQIKSGQDITAQQVGAETDSLTSSSGQSIWSAQSLQAEEGVSNPGGTDLSPDYKQAFTGSDSASAITSWADTAIAAAVTPLIPASLVCSPEGQDVQIVAMLGLSATSIFDDGLSAAGVGTLIAKFGEDAAVSMVAMHFVKDFVLSKTTDAKLAKDAFSGSLGGNLLAYGSQAAGDMASVASGGIKLSSSAASALAYNQQQQTNKQFQSQSLFARIFNVDDYQSLFGRLADSISPSLSANFASGMADLSSIPHNLISSISSLFTPKTEADNSYSFDMSTYGIPESILNNPAYANPYQNADIVANYLNANCLNSDGSVNAGCNGYENSIIARAQTCFGAEIFKDSAGEWDIKMDPTPADPTSLNYQNANCADTSDTNWVRMMLFVADTRTMQGIACYEGDETSCNEVGDNQDSAPAPTTTSATCNSVSSNNYFTVVGKAICVSSTKQQYIPYGVSVVDDLDQPDWCTTQNEAASDAQIQAAAHYWHVNTIRLQVSEDNFTDTAICKNGNAVYTGQDAMSRLQQEVNEIEQYGDIPVINDNTEFTGGTIAPSQSTIDFWNHVTTYFAGQNSTKYNNVIFDIFNEPETSGKVWQSGGSFDGSNYLGMQQVVNAIRNGPNLSNNLIFVEGEADQGYTHETSLTVLDNYPLTGTNLVYAYHHVNLNNSEDTWRETMGLNSGVNAPIVDGEWTQYASTRNFECYVQAPSNIASYFNLMQQNNIGMIFWSLEPGVGTVNGSTAFPVSDTITNNFPTTASGYSDPTKFNSDYSCSVDSSGNLLGIGAGQQVMNYFEQNSQSVGGS